MRNSKETSSREGLGSLGGLLVRSTAVLVATLLASLVLARMTLDVVHAEAEELVIIQLDERVDVEAGMVLLSQVATLDGDESRADELGGVIVCRAPESAEGVNLVAGRIKRALIRAGHAKDSFLIDGDSVRLYLHTYTVVVEDESAGAASDESAAQASEEQAEAAPRGPVMGVITDRAPRTGFDGDEMGVQQAEPIADRVAESAPRADSGERQPAAAQGSRDAGKAQDDYRPGQYFSKLLEEKEAGDEASVKKQAPASDVVELVIDTIRTSTAELLDLDERDVQVTEVRRNGNLHTLPKGAQRLASDIEKLNLGADLGQLRFRFSVEVDGETYDDLVLTVDVVRFASVVTYARDVRQKQAVAEADLQLQRLPFDTKATNYFTQIDDVLGMAPRTSGRAGNIVEPSDLEHATLIKRGEIVVVVYRSGSLTVECRAKALSDGVRGDVIEFERINPGRTQRGEKAAKIYGVVSASGRAEVATAAASTTR